MSVLKVLSQVAIYIVLTVLAMSWLFPFYWLVSSSLKVDEQILRFPPVWVPNPLDWHNYVEAVQYFPFFMYLRNSLIIGGLATLGAVISNPLTAYSFSRIQWPGRNVLFVVTLSTMMLPFAVTMIPVFLIFKRIGWVGTWLPLIVPAFLGNAFYIFLIRQFFMGIPRELSDAAYIDGASEFVIFWRVIVPLARPVLASVALFEFMARWRDFLGPLIYLSKDNLYPIALGLQHYITSHHTAWALLMAAATMVTLPTLVAFLFTQRTFIENVTFTGIKG